MKDIYLNIRCCLLYIISKDNFKVPSVMHATTKYDFSNNTVCLYALYDFSKSKTSEYSKILKRKINHLFTIKHDTAS